MNADSAEMQAQVQHQRSVLGETEQKVTKAVAKLSALRATVADIDASMRGSGVPADAIAVLKDVLNLEMAAVRMITGSICLHVFVYQLVMWVPITLCDSNAGWRTSRK